MGVEDINSKQAHPIAIALMEQFGEDFFLKAKEVNEIISDIITLKGDIRNKLSKPDEAAGNYGLEVTVEGEEKFYSWKLLAEQMAGFPSADKGNFGERLQDMIEKAQPNDTIDARYAEEDARPLAEKHFYITQNIIINKPLNILLPAGRIIGGDLNTDENMFEIHSSLVTIRGTGRSPREELRVNTTALEINEKEKGYHFYSRGNSVITIEGMDLYGVRTEHYDAQEDNPSKPINGSGGIYIEKANPGTTSSGNTVQNITIEDVLITATKYHGIYIDTPILCSLKNVRVAEGGGHGIFLNGGTSTRIENCYVSSTHKAGFAMYAHSYTTLISCASEYSGIGYWMRDCFSISLISCGAERCGNRAANVPNGNMTTTDDQENRVIISDVGSDNVSLFRGSSFVITGGYGIIIQNPTSANAGRPTGRGSTVDSRDFAILGNARGITIINPRTTLTTGNRYYGRFNIAFMSFAGSTPRDCELIFNVKEDGIVVPEQPGEYISNNNDSSHAAPVYIERGANVVVRAGNVFFTDLTIPKL